MNYAEIAKQSRLKCLELVFKAQTSHIGSLMSCADIFAVLFERIDLKKDKFILSAGWKACMLYYHLWRKGVIRETELNSYCQSGSKFIGLAENIIPEIPFAGGSMGMGLPAAVGFALSKKLKGEEGMVYVLMSDGEMQCGTTWEAALIAHQHKLNNLFVIVDFNYLQAMGRVEDILDIEPLRFKFSDFGWNAFETNGHDYELMENAINQAHEFLGEDDKPICMIVRTTKGKGVSFMEGNNLWHYAQIKEDDYKKALAELNG